MVERVTQHDEVRRWNTYSATLVTVRGAGKGNESDEEEGKNGENLHVDFVVVMFPRRQFLLW